MFDFQPPTRPARPSAVRWGDPPPDDGRRGRLVIVAAVVVTGLTLLALDEANQYDPVRERARLERSLEATRGAIKEVTARRDRILELDRQADTDPGVIQKEWLPPAWQLPVTFASVEEWHAAAKRRVRTADAELKALADTDARLRAEVAALPPPEANRVSLTRRLLTLLLGDLDPHRED